MIAYNLSIFAATHDVSGTTDGGIEMSGEIECSSGECTGTLSDNDGVGHEFTGEYSGSLDISGETDDGYSIDLEID